MDKNNSISIANISRHKLQEIILTIILYILHLTKHLPCNKIIGVPTFQPIQTPEYTPGCKLEDPLNANHVE